jgi:hypothetical protein
MTATKVAACGGRGGAVHARRVGLRFVIREDGCKVSLRALEKEVHKMAWQEGVDPVRDAGPKVVSGAEGLPFLGRR